MSEESFAPISADESQVSAQDAQTDEKYLTPDEFGNLVGIERQTVSYHLRKGLLNRFVVSGRIQVDPYRIPASLVEWYLSQKGISAGAKPSKVSAPLPQVSSSNEAQVSQVSPQTQAQSSANIDLLIAKMTELADKVLTVSDENKKLNNQVNEQKSQLQTLNNERTNYNNALVKAKDHESENTQLRGENATLRKELAETKQRLEALSKAPSWMFWKK